MTPTPEDLAEIASALSDRTVRDFLFCAKGGIYKLHGVKPTDYELIARLAVFGAQLLEVQEKCWGRIVLGFRPGIKPGTTGLVPIHDWSAAHLEALIEDVRSRSEFGGEEDETDLN